MISVVWSPDLGPKSPLQAAKLRGDSCRMTLTVTVAVKPHMTSFSTNLVVSDADCFVMVLPTFRSMGRPGRGGVGKVVVVY